MNENMEIDKNYLLDKNYPSHNDENTEEDNEFKFDKFKYISEKLHDDK
jgi:hypothetical protein